MGILETLMRLKRGYWYEVPAEFRANHYITVDLNEAGLQLKHLAHHWTNLSIPTEFEFGPEMEMPIWDSVKKEMIFRQVIKVSMMNERIKSAL